MALLATFGRIEQPSITVCLRPRPSKCWEHSFGSASLADGAVLKVSGRPADLATVLTAARDADARVVGRAALGLSWVTVTGDDLDDLAGRAETVRRALAPRPCTLQDAPTVVRGALPPWGEPDPGALVVMRRVKERFDPARIFSPGSFVGGI